MFLKTNSGTAYIHNFDSLDLEKEIVVFIPGAGMDHRVADLISLNSNVFNRVLSIDLPGHGGSTPGDAKTIEEYASFISYIIKEIDISDIHLCGHSMGGLVAMELAAFDSKFFKSVTLFNCQYPLFVGSALLDGSSRNLDGAADFLTKYGIHKLPKIEKPKKAFGAMGSSFYKKADGKIISPYGSKKVNDPDKEVALFGLKKLFNQVSKDILSIDMHACMNYRMDENNIKSIKNINILIGEMDKLVSEKKIDEMIAMFGDANLKKMEGVAHFPFFEDPKILNESLEDIFNTYI